MIITNSTSDSPYFEQMMGFLQSLSTNSPDHIIKVFLINYPIEKANRLSEVFDRFEFENESMEMMEDKRFSLIIHRADAIRRCFEKYKESVAWIDTDVIVRKDLSGFLGIGPNQLKILYRGLPPNPGPADSPINAGIFNVGYSEATYNFVCDWYRGCLNNPLWGQGQMEFWKSYNKYKDKIDLIKMPDKFNDLGGRGVFSRDSVMWHCKQNHFEDAAFRKEFDVYLKLSEERYYGE